MDLQQTEINGMDCIIKDLHFDNLVFTHIAGLFIVNEKLQDKFPECVAAINENLGAELLTGEVRLSKPEETNGFFVAQDIEGCTTQAWIIAIEDVKYTFADTSDSIKWYWYIDKFYVNKCHFDKFKTYINSLNKGEPIKVNLIKVQMEAGFRKPVCVTIGAERDIILSL
jgi:hypothetical protein